MDRQHFNQGKLLVFFVSLLSLYLSGKLLTYGDSLHSCNLHLSLISCVMSSQLRNFQGKQQRTTTFCRLNLWGKLIIYLSRYNDYINNFRDNYNDNNHSSIAMMMVMMIMIIILKNEKKEVVRGE